MTEPDKQEVIELSQEEISFLRESVGIDVQTISDLEKGLQATDEAFKGREGSDVNPLVSVLLSTVVCEGPDAFADYAQYSFGEIYEAAIDDSDVVHALVLGYKLGVAQKNGTCANNLGALNYMGELVEQDYQKAAALYNQAIDWGCYQSIVNLGYIYEYGRTGEPDYYQAFMYYSLAAALDQHPEALYKLGDLFNRGKPFSRNKGKAVQLWEKSLEVSDDLEISAQAAIRIAPLTLNPDDAESGVEFNPMRGLELYEIAENGIRISLDNGLTYYKKRLTEAIEGQQRARELLDNTCIASSE